MILKQNISIVITTFNKDYYNEKFNKEFNYGDKIEVPIDILAPFSQKRVSVQCDYCGKIYEATFCKVSSHPHDIACKDCKIIKIHKTMLERYGTTQNTLIPEVQEKIKKDSLEKYGVENPMNSIGAREKAKKTNLIKYGVEYPLQNYEIFSRTNTTDNVAVSSNQIKLQQILGGSLNYPIDKFFIDILIDNKICFEYDGGGHWKAVYMGRITMEKFIEKEHQRDNKIIENGYKVFRFLCPNDRLPNESEIIQIYYTGLDLLEKYNKIIYDNNKRCFILP